MFAFSPYGQGVRVGLKRAAAVVVTAVVAVCAMTSSALAAAPTGLTGMARDGAVELSWQQVTGATSYRVFRGTSATTVNTPLLGSPLAPVDPAAPVTFTDITP